MSLKKALKEMAEKVLPGIKQQNARKAEEERQIQWHTKQKRQFEAGEEIEPPWVSFPSSDPMTLWVSWRYGNFWLDTIWKPFWNQLNNKERKEYFEKWNPPDDGWYENITVYWDEGSSVKSEWFKEQRHKFVAGEEVEPPWIVFPLSSPNYGWDQGLWRKLEVAGLAALLEKIKQSSTEGIY